MSYTYVATSFKNGIPLAAFHRKHELEGWCQREINEDYPSGGWLALYRVRSYPCKVVELASVIQDGRVELIEVVS